MKVDLKNKTAIITGASGGIGRGIALIFAENGANVVISDIDEKNGNGVVEEISSAGGTAVFIKTDVGNADEAKAMANYAVK